MRRVVVEVAQEIVGVWKKVGGVMFDEKRGVVADWTVPIVAQVELGVRFAREALVDGYDAPMARIFDVEGS